MSCQRRLRALALFALLLPPDMARAGQSVKGTYSEADAGRLDLVDGIAWTSAAGGGTVVYLTTKPIASSALGGACPVTEARGMILLRDAAWVEVTPDAKGLSKHFAWGRTFGAARGGRQADMGDHPWTITLRKSPPGTIAGSVAYGDHGSFDFDLPVRHPGVPEISEAQAYDDAVAGTPPSPEAFKAAFLAVRLAALKKDLPAFLAAQGYSATQIAAIRALPGIDADFARLSLRFLKKEVRHKPSFKGGRGSLTAEGTNAEGKSFYNYYYLTTCGTRFILTTMAENPH